MICEAKPAAATPTEDPVEKYLEKWRGTYAIDSPRNRRLDLMARDDFRCKFCGYDFLASPAALLFATIDHLKPKARGGPDSPRNLVACCVACNQIKGTGHGDLNEVRGLVQRRRALYIVELVERLSGLGYSFPRQSEQPDEERAVLNIAARLLGKRAEVITDALEALWRVE